MMVYGIRDAISRGGREFDFMRGDEEYKFRFTKQKRFTQKFFFSKNGFVLNLFNGIERMN
jgi:hypothetical protein